MKKSLLILTLLCGAFTAQAEEVSLSLSNELTTLIPNQNGITTSWVTGLAGTSKNAWSLPTAEAVLTDVAQTTFMSTTGLYYGMGDGKHFTTADCTLNTSGDGFSYTGRQAYTGTYVAQVYDVSDIFTSSGISYADTLTAISVSFSTSTTDANTSFSIWTYNATTGSVTMVAGSAENTSLVSSDTLTFTASDLSLGADDRLMLIWNANSYAAVTTVSDVNITTELVPEPATATLSLLALAGLAARRRRR